MLEQPRARRGRGAAVEVDVVDAQDAADAKQTSSRRLLVEGVAPDGAARVPPPRSRFLEGEERLSRLQEVLEVEDRSIAASSTRLPVDVGPGLRGYLPAVARVWLVAIAPLVGLLAGLPVSAAAVAVLLALAVIEATPLRRIGAVRRIGPEEVALTVILQVVVALVLPAVAAFAGEAGRSLGTLAVAYLALALGAGLAAGLLLARRRAGRRVALAGRVCRVLAFSALFLALLAGGQ